MTRGADLLAATLRKAGVSTVFSLSGNQIMAVYDAALDHGLRIVHTRHEAGAVFMAEGWAQASGGLGVALVTAAPGFANALGALYSARMSETPLLLLSGDSPVAQDGMGAFQEFDQVSAAMPYVKLSRRSMRAENLANDVAEAIRTALSGRPGPVHLALPADVLTGDAGAAVIPGPGAFERKLHPPKPEDLETLAGLLGTGGRVVILTGPALNWTRKGDLLRRLTEAYDVPVVPMESPRGLRDPALGAFADSLREADFVVYLGKPADFTTNFGRGGALGDAEIVFVDPDTMPLYRAKRNLEHPFRAFAADADLMAAALIEAAPTPKKPRSAWREDVEAAIRERTLIETAKVDGIGPQAIGAALAKAMAEHPRALAVIDGGEFGQWAQAYAPTDRRIINGTSGAIGGSLCQAIGAKLARPGSPVFAVMGDGTAGFYLAEFDTAVRAGAPVIAIIGNDARWNAEYLIQLREFGPDRLTGCELNPDARYDLAAAALGCHGEYVTAEAELAPALARADASGKPACVNIAMTGLPAPVFARKFMTGDAH